MPGNDDIVLKLIIKGQDPAEMIRLANETSGRLAEESAKHINRLTQLHKEAAQAQSDAQKKAVDEEIKNSEKLLDAIQKIERQREIVANRAKGSMDRMLERLENVTTVATGLINAFKAQANAAFQLGEDIDRLTNVYGSLKGSIEEMRTASAGEISDYDLILTKNRAMQLDLQLTDKQFGIVARAADNFADSLGVNTKEAMDKLIDGLATGRTKTLEHAGAIKDVSEVYEKFAKSIGTTADKLSDQGKRVAVVEEALRNLDKKNKESGALVDDFSHRWEKFSSEIKNLADAFKIHLGEAIMFVFNNLSKIPDALRLMKAQFLDMMAFGKTDNYSRVANEIEARNAASEAAASDAMIKASTASTPDELKYVGDKSRLIKSPSPSDARAAEAAAAAKAKFNEQFDQMLRGGKKAGPAYGLGPNNSFGSEEDQLSADVISGGADEYVKDNQAKADSYAALQAKVRGEAQKTADAMAETLAKVAARKDALNATAEKAGGGLFSMILFGPDGPDKTYAEMDAFQQATVDMMAAISDTAHKMAEAVGQSLANWVANTQGAKKSFRDMTNELLIQLSTQAYVKGLMEVAEAIASFATYNYDAGAKHLEAAGAYALVGIAAGLGARAIGHNSSTSSPTTSSATGSGYGATAPAAGASGGGGSAPITINLSVFPGGEAEAGRQINLALERYYAQTGRGVRAAA